MSSHTKKRRQIDVAGLDESSTGDAVGQDAEVVAIRFHVARIAYFSGDLDAVAGHFHASSQRHGDGTAHAEAESRDIQDGYYVDAAGYALDTHYRGLFDRISLILALLHQ
jgi:hypothetical protein